MHVLRSRFIALAAASVFVLGACGPSVANPVDPVGGVAAAFDIAKAGGTLKAMDLVTCISTGGALGSALSGLLGGLTAAQIAKFGITADDINGAIKVGFADLKTTEVSRSGDQATVHVNVKVTTDVDPGKMRDLVKKYSATQGVVPDDATIDAAIKARLGGQYTQSETISKDVRVVQQNGKWVACGAEFAAPGVTVGTPGLNGAPTGGVGLATGAAPSTGLLPGTTLAPGATGSTTIPNISGSTVAIAAGNGFACALISDGSVKCWGRNSGGQLGDGATADSATPVTPSGLGAGVKSISIDTFGSSACAVTGNGAVKCWGTGQLGNGSSSTSSTPVDVVGISSGASSVAVATNDVCVVMTSGGAKCWGKNDQGQLGNGSAVDSGIPVDVAGLGAVAAIAPSQAHTCALTVAGGVKCWGNKNGGTLGNGSTAGSLTPVDVVGIVGAVTKLTTGQYGNCVLAATGGVKCWGGNNTIATDVVGLSSGVRDIIAAVGTCAFTTDARILCWGSDPTPKDATAQFGGTFSALVFGGNGAGTGPNVTCILTSAGGVACLDQNVWKEISGLTPGSGGPVPSPSQAAAGTVASVSVGLQHSCVVTTAGGAMCWGSNPGNGTTTSKTPVGVLGLTSGVKAVATGTSFSCALTDAGAVMCWGDSTYGQLGNGATSNSTIPVAVTGLNSGVAAIAAAGNQACALLQTGAAKCWGQYGALSPVAVPGLSGLTAISVGSHICALTGAGGIKCWTYPQSPQDVTGFTTGIKAIDAGPYDCALLIAGGAKCRFGTADLSSLVGTLNAISGTCVITGTGGVKCWGSNLGNGTTATGTTPVDAAGLTSGVQAIDSGDDGTCAVTADHALWCWGNNGYGSIPANTIPTRFPGL